MRLEKFITSTTLEFSVVKVDYPQKGLPYFAVLPYYLWGEVNYNSDGDCLNPLDRMWTYLDVYDRSNKSNYFVINVIKNRTKLIVKGDGDSVKKIYEFFSNSPNEKAMKRVLAVNYCFEHPAVKKFNNHTFWGSWKWIGTMSSDFTITGRWIMLDAMRNSTQGVWVASSWLSHAKINNIQEQVIALSMHIKEVCSLSGLSDRKYYEPDSDEWENDLLHYYISILKDFNCDDDELMLKGSRVNEDIYNKDDTSSTNDDIENDNDEIADQWRHYGIDIYSKDAIDVFKTMEMFEILDESWYDINECTYNITQDTFTVQKSYKCNDCFPCDTGSPGVCEFCSKECIQKGHSLSKVKYSPFYCDKGYIADNNSN